MLRTVSFTLNGKPEKLAVDDERLLLWVLRSDLGLTGTKFGCGAGLCGACTVLVEGEAVRSCQTKVKEIAGKKVLTIEGLAAGSRLHPIQEAFLTGHAFQCGFCTSGMILAAHALLGKTPHPTRAQIVRGMDDNFCRCGSHKRILEAVESAAAMAAAATPAGGAK